jgi:hypothetical protein
VELLDNSSNGTLVNDRPVGKGRTVRLSNMDEIVVLRDSTPERKCAAGVAGRAVPVRSR